MSDDRPDDLMAALRASVEAAKKRRTASDEPARCEHVHTVDCSYWCPGPVAPQPQPAPKHELMELCEFVVQQHPEVICLADGHWEVRTTCPHCHVATRDVLCQLHGTDVFAGSAAHFVCRNCCGASFAPPAAWVRVPL